MNTNPSLALQKDTFIKAVDSTDSEFFIINPTSQTMHIKFTTDDVAPTGLEGAIPLLPQKAVTRGTIIGYPWLEGETDTKASITA